MSVPSPFTSLRVPVLHQHHSGLSDYLAIELLLLLPLLNSCVYTSGFEMRQENDHNVGKKEKKNKMKREIRKKEKGNQERQDCLLLRSVLRLLLFHVGNWEPPAGCRILVSEHSPGCRRCMLQTKIHYRYGRFIRRRSQRRDGSSRIPLFITYQATGIQLYHKSLIS